MKDSAGKTTVWINGLLATMNPEIDRQYGLIKDMALVTEGPRISALVPQAGLDVFRYDQVIDLQGALVTPGLIDCHNHLVFGGNRAKEWEMRLNGISYAEIAAKGGGIKSTVAATREGSFEDLYESALKRLEALAAEGVTTVEVKSGYGLEMATERKQLELVQALKENFRADFSPTLLAAHSVPAEYAGRADEYVEYICQEIMPALWREDLFETVDVFCENIAFSLEQTEKLFAAAKALGAPVKAHAEQMSNIGCSALVARYNGLSVDHIEHLDEAAIVELSKSGTVATLLPMAYYFLRDTNMPPVKLLRQHKVPMAVSTDFNPGTSPFASIRMAMNMACTLFGLTPAEAMAGVTRNAAKALGREARQGQLKTGYEANLAVWDVKEPVEIFYELGHNPLIYRVYNGLID